MDQLVFLILSVLAVGGALSVILTPNPIYSVLFLVLTFFSIAGHYAFILGAQFLAVVNIIVYAGAIMVLFLFVIMLLNLNKIDEFRKPFLVKAVGIFCGGLFVLTLLAAILTGYTEPDTSVRYGAAEIGTVHKLGEVLFGEFILPFEACSVLFLSAMIGAVMLGKKNLKDH
jgi:NADH-quinone oxidoreductase subunit J